MDLNYNIFVNKTKIMLKTIKKEYEIIIQNYSEEKIIKKSYSIKSRDSLNNKEKEYADSILEQFFEPSLKQISILIDSGIISWDSAIEPISLNDINKDIKDFKHLIYESWEKLYVYKHIKYDLIYEFYNSNIFIYRKGNSNVFKPKIQKRKFKYNVFMYKCD